MPLIVLALFLLLGFATLGALFVVSTSVRREFAAGQAAVADGLIPMTWKHGPNTLMDGKVLDEVRALASALRDGRPALVSRAASSIFRTSYEAGVDHALDVLDKIVADATPASTSYRTDSDPKPPLLIDVFRAITKVDNVLLLAADSKTNSKAKP